LNDGKGKLYIFGGISSSNTVVNEMLSIDTKQTPWLLAAEVTAPEGRAFHIATLLPDNTMLIMWGMLIRLN
jgi:hypothetical protein